ncbi:MAG TPA: ATP-binding protein [Polyangiaceae bacterium]|jgi:hypothetical protein
MKFLDRRQEHDRLERLRNAPDGGLAVVWGRRRVGKTRLLAEWVRDTDGCYVVVDESAAAIQRRFFAQALEQRLPDFAAVEYRDWRSLLARLAQDAKAIRFRGPIVIDELPYLVNSSPELPSTLQHWLDHEAKDARLVVVIAGSSQRMMQGLVLGAAAPLYGRAKEVLRLGPLPAGYLGQALGASSVTQTLRHYAAWGGIPRYWELAAEVAESVDECVDQLVLDPLGTLHTEPDRLLLEETPHAIALRPLLDAIGQGAHRLSEIGARVGQPATSLSRPLSRLIEMDLVYKEYPFGESEKSSKRSLYRIADPFFRLWFRLVAPHRSFLLQAPRSARRKLWLKHCDHLVAASWEELSRRAVVRLSEIQHALSEFSWEPAARFWTGRGPEWDIVARSSDGKHLLLGEVKWSNRPFSPLEIARLSQALLAKGVPEPFARAKVRTHHALFLNATGHSARGARSPVSVVDGRHVLGCLR